MLPWKKHKFDLIEESREHQQSKQKLYGVSLNYSALTSFARSCPESAFNRMGSMFKSKRKKINITSQDPTYTVLYLGNATTIQSKGDGCTDTAVAKIWAKSELGKNGTKMRLTVSSQGIRMVHVDEKSHRPGHLYLLHRVTYCVADPRLPRVFAWIYRHELKHKAVMLRCHAVLVSRPEKAQAMALLLYQTSATALAEFKRLKRRNDARHQQQQRLLVGGGGEGSVPLLPLRKLLLLQGQNQYKPPVERSRSAPKLGSIMEDSAGEQQQQEQQKDRGQHDRKQQKDRGQQEQQQHEQQKDRGQQEQLYRGQLQQEQQKDLFMQEDSTGGQQECEDQLEEQEAVQDTLEQECEDQLEQQECEDKPELSEIINDLTQMSIGNDVQSLRADLRVTRLLSGESTGSDSSIESNSDHAQPLQSHARITKDFKTHKVQQVAF